MLVGCQLVQVFTNALYTINYYDMKWYVTCPFQYSEIFNSQNYNILHKHPNESSCFMNLFFVLL